MGKINLQITLLLYSTSLSVFSFFIVKLIILVVKAVICYFFGIDFIIKGFWLMAISPAHSGLWAFDSVYTVYGTELIIPLLIFFLSLLFYNHFKKLDQHRTAFTVWFMFYSVLFFFSAITSGAVTYSNTYHLFNWFYLPNHLIMAIALAIPLLLLTILYLGKGRILKLAPDNTWLENEPGRRRTHLLGFAIPLALTAITLYILAGGHPNRYAAYESGLMIFAAIALSIYRPSPTYRKVEENWMPSPRKKAIIAVSILTLTAILRWIF